MAIDQYGQELDENGHILAMVEAWRPFGIYPPPLAGIPTPLGVAQIRESRERWAAMSGQEREERRIKTAEFIRHWDEENPELAKLVPSNSL